MIGTPCNLEVLLHCYYCASVHPRMDAPAVQDAIRYLLSSKMIEQDNQHYRTTAKGKFYVDHLMKIPFPVITFTIPNDTSTTTPVR